jgi:hypothetical protein
MKWDIACHAKTWVWTTLVSNTRALYALIPAAILCSVLLVGLEQSGRQSSAPAPDVTVNPSGATVVSLAAPAPSETAEARVDEKAGNGGDGGTPLVATPASTTTVVNARVEGERPIPPADAVKSQSGDGEVSSTAANAGSTPAPSATPIIRSSSQAPLRSAIEAAFPPSEVETAYRVAMCESGGDPTEVGAAGEEGAFQVLAVFHGEVPADIYGQAEQAAGIVAEQGWGPWSCQ